MQLLPSRITTLLAVTMVATTAALALPTSAFAILTGMESNSELVNSDRTEEQRRDALNKMRKAGVQVVRVNLGWNEIAGGCKGQSPFRLTKPDNDCYDWSRVDSLVKLTKARRLQLLVSVTRVPEWVLNNDDPAYMGASSKQFNYLTQHYASFMYAMGKRYGNRSQIGTIRYWTILNEPNAPVFWQPRPNAQRYAYIYAKSAVALKRAHPGAVIAPGPTGPTGGKAKDGAIQPVLFIRAFQRAVPRFLPGKTMALKRRYINAWAHNPYPGVKSQPSVSSSVVNRFSIGMGNIDRLFTELDRSSLTKNLRVWGTEFGWQTDRDFFSVTPAQQAQFIAEAYDWLDSKKRVTIGISYGLTDPIEKPDFQSGIYYNDGTAKPSATMFQRMISVPQAGKANRVRRNAVVNIWGRSNLSTRRGRLVYRTPGSRCNPRGTALTWCIVPGQRRAFDGSIRAKMRISSTKVEFAVYDGVKSVDGGYGAVRAFRSF